MIMTELNLFADLTWIFVTLFAYLLALYVYKKCNSWIILHPLVIAVGCVGVSLWFTQTAVQNYQSHTALLHWMLGPATVALAIPLRNQLVNLKQYWNKILPAIVVGGISAPILAGLVLYSAQLDIGLIMTMLTKSITTPLAMDTAAMIGGYPSLAAVFVILTGIIGAVLCSVIFRLGGVKSEIAQGVALGTVAHAVGTAQAFQLSEKTGAFASLALCINGLLTAIILPLLYFWLN